MKPPVAPSRITTREVDPEPDEHDDSRATIALVVASVAMLFSVAALGISIGLLVDHDLPDTVATPVSTSPSAVSTESEITDDVSAPPGWLDPGAIFNLAYADQVLRVQLPPCGTALPKYVDLDEPRVGADAPTAEFYYETKTSCNGSAQLNMLEGVAVAIAPKAAPTAAQCAQALRNAPANEPVAIAPKLTLCIATSPAAEAKTPEKIVLLTITAIGKDGTATMRAKSWDIAR
jgi:hypothetical protein